MKAVLGERIRHCRKAAKLSQERLASDIGVTEQTIARIEKGENWPEYDNLAAIATRLGATIPELLHNLSGNGPHDLGIVALRRETLIRAVLDLGDEELNLAAKVLTEMAEGNREIRAELIQLIATRPANEVELARLAVETTFKLPPYQRATHPPAPRVQNRKQG